jgi:hypothetical protein
MELLCLVVAERMVAPSHPGSRKVLILDLQLLDVFSCILLIVSELALLFYLLRRPRQYLTPFTTIFLVISMVFKTSFSRSY